MIDSFYIGAYWGPRAEPLSEVSGKILQTFEKLITVDEQFLNWYEGGMSRKKALEKKVVFNKETIETLCLQLVKKGELDQKGFAKMGFLFGLWSGHSDEESSSISFNVGKENERLTNACVISIPFEGAARERLLEPGKAKEIISILIEIWNPDYAVLASSELNNMLEIVNDIGWITYRKSLKRMPKISDKVIYEKFGNGHLFHLANESSYNYNLANELLPLKQVIK